MDDSSESPESSTVVDKSVVDSIQNLLQHIEHHGGEYQQGREALERLKQTLEYVPSSEAPVMEQMRDIQEALKRVETKLANLSEESLGIVSSSVQSLPHEEN